MSRNHISMRIIKWNGEFAITKNCKYQGKMWSNFLRRWSTKTGKNQRNLKKIQANNNSRSWRTSITIDYGSSSFQIVHSNTSLQQVRNRVSAQTQNHGMLNASPVKPQTLKPIIYLLNLTRNLWFSSNKGENLPQKSSMSETSSPLTPTTLINFFLSGANFKATCIQLIGFQ